MADDILSLLGGMKQPTPTESFAQNLLGYQRPSMSMEPMAQSMLGYQPSSIELDPMERTIQPSIMDRVSSGLGGIGSAFTGPGSNARLQALAASLLTGPSRTPISFGSQLAKGLLAGTQAAQAEEDRLLKQDLLERQARAEELKALKSLSKPSVVAAEPYRLPDGSIVESFADKETLQRVYRDPATGEVTAIPPGSIPISKAGLADAKTLGSLQEAAVEDERRLKAIDSYLSDVEGSNQGFARLFDIISSGAKTLLGPDYKLTKEELATATGQKQLQELIGKFRIDIVGGGVMTEQDAIRIIQALGGDFDMLQNKEVVRKILNEMKDDIGQRYGMAVDRYNNYLQTTPTGSALINVFSPMEKYGYAPQENKNGAPEDPLGLRK